MKEAIAHMLGLQRHHDAIRRCEGFLAEIEAQRREIETRSKARTQHNEQLARQIKRVQADTAAAENELRSSEASLQKLRQRYDTVNSPREATALEREIDLAEEKKQQTETTVLELMEQNESLRTALDEALAAHESAEKDEASQLQQAAERAETYAGQLEEHRQSWELGCEELPPNVRSRFMKIAGSADGRAIVAVDRNSCGGCHFNIPADLLTRVNAGEVSNCPHCGKYLYIQ